MLIVYILNYKHSQNNAPINGALYIKHILAYAFYNSDNTDLLDSPRSLLY